MSVGGSTVVQHPSRYKVEPMEGLEVYKIGREAIITLQPSTGYVSVSCPWHDELNGCHWWNARGKESLHEFLIGLQRYYAMGKLFSRRALEEYDEEQTVRSIKEDIIRMRRDGDYTEEQARDLWDELEACETGEDVANLTDCHGNRWYESIKTKPKSCADWFWNEVWAAFIAHLKGSARD